jgi:hypothetical protein
MYEEQIDLRSYGITKLVHATVCLCVCVCVCVFECVHARAACAHKTHEIHFCLCKYV